MLKSVEKYLFLSTKLCKHLWKMPVYKFSEKVETIFTDKVTKPIGPYSQAKVVKTGCNLVFTSGYLGLNPEVGVHVMCTNIFFQDINICFR